MSDLKPCPMCAGDPIIIQEDRVWIECADCPSKVEVGPFDGEAEAIAAWNERKGVGTNDTLSSRIIARADTVLGLPVSDTFADGFREAWREARLLARGE